ncbi:MAG: arginine deiminase [Actinomycetota bacterium]|nr:arginine deiminase [Actinomycetota bacterium]
MARTAVGVRTEVGRLRTVLVHRPDLELRRVTPSNMDELLFDELIWVDRAQEEHDDFVRVLSDAGTEVLYLERLLADVLSDGEVAREVVHSQVTDTTCGPGLVDSVRGFLLELPIEALVRHLIGGVALADLDESDSFVARVHRPFEPLLRPLPNAVFMRDSSAWVGEGAVISPMNRLVRRREADLLRLVYLLHPFFAGVPIWFGEERREYYPATVEGGDVLVVAEDALAIGVSERTTPPGVETLAMRLFEAGVVKRILAVELPRARGTMHLDTVVTMVDHGTFLLYPRIRPHVRCLRLTPRGGGRLEVAEGADLLTELAWACGVERVRSLEPDLDSVEAEREQWNDGNNVLAVAPGEIVAYERNPATNAVLEEAGLIVHRIPSFELPRGRGGPRCMTCPTLRDPP